MGFNNSEGHAIDLLKASITTGAISEQVVYSNYTTRMGSQGRKAFLLKSSTLHESVYGTAKC